MRTAKAGRIGRRAGPGGWRRIAQLVGVDLRPGEEATALLLFLCFFVCLTFQYTAKTVRQSTFIDTLGAARLPLVYLLVALASLPVLALYSRAADRLSRHHVVAATALIVAGTLVVFWWLFREPTAIVAAAYYVWISIALALTLTQLWSFANHVFNPRQAKRLFGFVGAGALLGGMAGGQLARYASLRFETRDALLAAAAVLLLLIALVYAIQRAHPAVSAISAGRREEHGRFTELRRSRHLSLIAALMLLAVVVSQIVDLQFNWAVESTTTGLDQRTAFFGNFFTVMGAAAFAFQLAFTTRIHRVLGIGVALRVLPWTMAGGTVALLVSAMFAPGLLVAAALALKVGESGLRYSLDDSTRELLFLPVPSRQRTHVKAYIDVVVKRGAKGLAALLLLPVTIGIVTPLQTGWLTLLLTMVWLAIAVAVAREYVRSFRRGLPRATDEDASSINLADATTVEILVQALGSSDPRQVLRSIDLLAANERSHLVPPVLLHHDDPEVRQRTLQVLAEANREDAAPVVERLLRDESPVVRAEAIRVLAELRHQDACLMMLPRLREAEPAVRGAAVACLTTHGTEEMQARADATLHDLLQDENPRVRSEGARAIGAVSEPRFSGALVELLYDHDTKVVEEAIEAIRTRLHRDGPEPLYLPTLISLLRNRHLKHDAREAIAAYGERAIPTLVHFMNEPEEPIWVRRAIPKTIALTGTTLAVDSLVACLATESDAFLRRKLIESLGSAKLADAAASFPASIQRAVRSEVRRFLATLVDLHAIDENAARSAGRLADDPDSPDESVLIVRLLTERLDDHRRNLFSLLGVLYGRRHIWDAYRGLVGRHPSLRAHALEYLDNALPVDDRRTVLAAIGDDPLEQKMSTAVALFGLHLESREATLVRLLTSYETGDSDARYFAVAALYLIRSAEIAELYPVVDRLSGESSDPFVQETASWVAQRVATISGEV